MSSAIKIFESREQWLEARRGGIGASDAPAILGVDPYRSSLEIYCEKLGLLDRDQDTNVMRWGRKLEPLIADAYEEETGRRLVDFGLHLFASEEVPFLFTTLDRGIPSLNGAVEIKTSGAVKENQIREELPLNWQVQGQHQLLVTGLSFVSFAIFLVIPRKLLWIDVERNESFIEVLRAKEEEFWRRVSEKNPPEPDASESAREILRKLYPRDGGTSISLPAEAESWDLQRLEATKEVDKWMAVKQEAENKIKAAIGDATYGVLSNGVSYSWRRQSRRGYTVADSEARVLRRHKKGDF